MFRTAVLSATTFLLFTLPIQAIEVQPHLSQNLLAQQVQDIQGWNNVRWGMTYEEVREIYPVSPLIPNVNNGTAYANHAIMPNFELGDSRYNVEFHFSREGILESVVLRWIKIGRAPTTDPLSALTARYGNPRDTSINTPDRIWARFKAQTLTPP